MPSAMTTMFGSAIPLQTRCEIRHIMFAAPVAWLVLQCTHFSGPHERLTATSPPRLQEGRSRAFSGLHRQQFPPPHWAT